VELDEILKSHTRWVIDTAPIIYYSEENPAYLHVVDKIFSRLNSPNGESAFAFSPIVTLSEVLTHPLRHNDQELAGRYREFLLKSHNFTLFYVDEIIAERAAAIRAGYNYRTPDAIQLATGVENHATLFITNDIRLKNFSELTVIVLDDFIDKKSTP